MSIKNPCGCVPRLSSSCSRSASRSRKGGAAGPERPVFFFPGTCQKGHSHRSVVIRVNSGTTLLTAPEEARRAVIAHELAHLAHYAKGNRLHLLGLWRFAGKGYRER